MKGLAETPTGGWGGRHDGSEWLQGNDDCVERYLAVQLLEVGLYGLKLALNLC